MATPQIITSTATENAHDRAFVSMFFHPGVEWSDEECAELARTYKVTAQAPVWMRGGPNV
jgi:hypothetical protein